MNGETNTNLESLYREFSDGELLRERVELVRALGRISDSLAIVNAERARRAPLNQAATIVPFRLAEGLE